MLDGNTIAEEDGDLSTSAAAEESKGSALIWKSSTEEETLPAPSRTASLTPTMIREFETRTEGENHARPATTDEETTYDSTVPQPSATSSVSVKQTRKIRPTRRGSTHSFSQTPHSVTAPPNSSNSTAARTGQSPMKKGQPGDSRKGNAGLSSSTSSTHGKMGGADLPTLSHLPVSTDNLLLHLHTDPRSSHITLSSTAAGGAKEVPSAQVNPSLLIAGGSNSLGVKSQSRSRTLSASSKLDKGKERASNAISPSTSLPASRLSSRERPGSVPSKGSVQPNNNLRNIGQTSDIVASPLAMPESTNTRNPPAPQEFAEAVAASAGNSSSRSTRYSGGSEDGTTSTDMSRTTSSHESSLANATSTEDWPSHVSPDFASAGQAYGHSGDSPSDLVSGGLAGTPRIGAGFRLQGHTSETTPHSLPLSPLTNTFAANDGPAQTPDSGLVPVTLSDSTAIKLETLVPGDTADKIEQTEDQEEKRAILQSVVANTAELIGGVQEPSPLKRPQGKAPSSELASGLGFINVDLSAANTTSTPPEQDGTASASLSTVIEQTDSSCISEFSSMLNEAMRSTSRRLSSTSSAGSIGSAERKGPTLIGAAGSLNDPGRSVSIIS
jgi:hypothetical protein